MDKILDLREIVMSLKEFERIVEGQLSNENVADMFDELASALNVFGNSDVAYRYKGRASSLRYCHKTMFFNHYEKQGVKDYQRTFHCRDRFCPLCAKARANSLEMRYNEVLSNFQKEYDLFHITLTIKNCDQYDLIKRIEAMHKGIQKLVRFLDGRAKIGGINFSQYGYAGAFRSLEIKFTDYDFHPHFHCIIALKKGVELPGANYNRFAFDQFTGEVNLFSDFEILIQKIWYLILNPHEVTNIANKIIAKAKENKLPLPQFKTNKSNEISMNKKIIDFLDLGYSCRLRRLSELDYHQTFKYTIKADDNSNGLSPSILLALDRALYKKHIIQGYGCFRGLKLDDETIDDSNDIIYDQIINQMKKLEFPTLVCESPKFILDQFYKNKIKYISRRAIRSFVRKHKLEEDLPFIVATPDSLKKFVQMIMCFRVEHNIMVCHDEQWVTYTPDEYDIKLATLRTATTFEGYQ